MQGVPESLGAPPEDTAGEPFKEKPFDPSPARENIRGQVALWLIWTLVGVIALVVVSAIVMAGICLNIACSDKAIELAPLRTVVELILTPLVGLVGAVTGFYFGEKSASAPPPQVEPAG
jgi:hypothetical protein